MSTSTETAPQAVEGAGISLLEFAIPLARHWLLLLLCPVLMGLAALGATYLIKPTFSSRTVFLPPQMQQSSAASALASLGALSGLAGAAGGIKSPADQYVALLNSTRIADRLIDEFKLIEAYEVRYRFEARRALAANSSITLGKRDGLITIEVEDQDRQRATDMANRYVEELRSLAGELALTEAQQRRAFFEAQLKQTHERLTAAQQSLQTSGFNSGALKTDARAAAEGYARLRAELTAAEVRARVLRQRMADDTPEVSQAMTTVAALRAQLAKQESAGDQAGNADYVSKFREFKYQETLFDLLARQFELARLDESNDRALIQIIDRATPAEWKSKPKRATVALLTVILSFLLLLAFVEARHFWRLALQQPQTAAQMGRLRNALRWSGS